MKKRKHLLSLVHSFPLWNSACRLIKLSLTGKTHSTQKINTHRFVFLFFFLARVCVLMECLSLLWRKMMRSIILHSLGRYKFLFPWRIHMFYKNIDQEFTVSCKGACMCGSCCHHSHITTAETYEWTTAELYWRIQDFHYTTSHLEAEVRKDDGWWIQGLVAKGSTELSCLFQKESSYLMIPFGGMNQVCHSVSFTRIRCLLLCT